MPRIAFGWIKMRRADCFFQVDLKVQICSRKVIAMEPNQFCRQEINLETEITTSFLFLLLGTFQNWGIDSPEAFYKSKMFCTLSKSSLALTEDITWARYCYVTWSRIHSVNFEILVQTPGRLGSAHPMPQLMIPPKKYRPSFPFTTNGPPESP